jgi:hypothetical protein
MRALQLAGMSERTQQCYTRSVRMLVDFYSKTPDKITESELTSEGRSLARIWYSMMLGKSL